jgi:hypothetical protein
MADQFKSKLLQATQNGSKLFTCTGLGNTINITTYNWDNLFQVFPSLAAMDQYVGLLDFSASDSWNPSLPIKSSYPTGLPLGAGIVLDALPGADVAKWSYDVRANASQLKNSQLPGTTNPLLQGTSLKTPVT